MKTLNALILSTLLLSPYAAQAGCEDGDAMAETKAIQMLAKKEHVSKRQCKAYDLANIDINGGEIHFVQTECGEARERYAVKLAEIEDAQCTVETGWKLQSLPGDMHGVFPEETSGFDNSKRFKKIFSADAGKMFKALKGKPFVKPYPELMKIALGNEVTEEDMANYDGFFTQIVDLKTGLVFWHVAAYPGDNEAGALIEVNPVFGERGTYTVFHMIAYVSDSWIDVDVR